MLNSVSIYSLYVFREKKGKSYDYIIRQFLIIYYFLLFIDVCTLSSELLNFSKFLYNLPIII